MGAWLACPGVELKLAASNTAETDSRVTERATCSAQALVELLCCCFMELFRLVRSSTHPHAVRILAQNTYCYFLIAFMRISCYKIDSAEPEL